MSTQHAETPDAFLLLLRSERDRLQNAVGHLQVSNNELKQAIDEAGPDADFKTAIEENIVVIAKYIARIARLDQEIRDMESELSSLRRMEALISQNQQMKNEGDGATGSQQQLGQLQPSKHQAQQQQSPDAGGPEHRGTRDMLEVQSVRQEQTRQLQTTLPEQQNAGQQGGLWL